MKKNSHGFTLIELIIAVTFFIILLSLVTINLLGARRQIAKGGNIDVLIADIKEQQAKAMSGEGTVISNYGVFLESAKYTLFTGSSYNPNDTANFAVDLDPSVTITNITFPNSIIVFTKLSGELSGYSSQTNSFKVNILNNSETVTFDKLGAVDRQ